MPESVWGEDATVVTAVVSAAVCACGKVQPVGRVLLETLRDWEADVLRFAYNLAVPRPFQPGRA
jgi:hypothetical protein